MAKTFILVPKNLNDKADGGSESRRQVRDEVKGTWADVLESGVTKTEGLEVLRVGRFSITLKAEDDQAQNVLESLLPATWVMADTLSPRPQSAFFVGEPAQQGLQCRLEREVGTRVDPELNRAVNALKVAMASSTTITEKFTSALNEAVSKAPDKTWDVEIAAVNVPLESPRDDSLAEQWRVHILNAKAMQNSLVAMVTDLWSGHQLCTSFEGVAVLGADKTSYIAHTPQDAVIAMDVSVKQLRELALLPSVGELRLLPTERNKAQMLQP